MIVFANPHNSLNIFSIQIEPNDPDIPYCNHINNLQFASQETRMDITYSMNHSTIFFEKVKVFHVAIVKHIMKYLKELFDL